jgi:hypothetical protein
LLESYDDVVVLDGHAIAADRHARVHEAAPGCDVEVPFVPGASNIRAFGVPGRRSVAEVDAADRATARAQRWAVIGEGVESVADAIEPNPVTGSSGSSQARQIGSWTGLPTRLLGLDGLIANGYLCR